MTPESSPCPCSEGSRLIGFVDAALRDSKPISDAHAEEIDTHLQGCAKCWDWTESRGLFSELVPPVLRLFRIRRNDLGT
jgi:hypothetical protein